MVTASAKHLRCSLTKRRSSAEALVAKVGDERRRRAVSSTGLRPSHGHFRRPRSANSMRLRSCGLRLSKAAGPRPSERRPYDVWHVTACLGVETTRSRASAYKTDLIPSYGGRQGLCRARGVGRPSRRRPAVAQRRNVLSDRTRKGKGLKFVQSLTPTLVSFVKLK